MAFTIPVQQKFIPAVLALLKTADPSDAKGEILAMQTLKWIVELCKTCNPQTQQQIQSQLTEQPDVLKELLSILSNSAERIKRHATLAIGTLTNGHPANQQLFYKALASNPAAAPALLTMLLSSDNEVKIFAVFAIGTLTSNHPANQQLFRDALASNPAAMSALLDMLSNPAERIKKYATIAIGNLITAAAPALLAMLSSSDDDVKRFTTFAIGTLTKCRPDNQQLFNNALANNAAPTSMPPLEALEQPAPEEEKPAKARLFSPPKTKRKQDAPENGSEKKPKTEPTTKPSSF